VSSELSDSVKWMRVLRDARGWERPSDHVPVMIRLEL
jgi:exodeoxyribonuclease III